MNIKKIFLTGLILVVIGFLLYYFLNLVQFNKSSYNYPKFNVSIDQTGKNVETWINSGDTKLIFGFPVANTKIITSGNITTLDSLDTAFKYEVKKEGSLQGLKETIVLKNKNASNEYSFNLKLENVSSFKKDPVKETWHFFNSKNKEIFYMPKGVMEDKNGIVSDAVDINIIKNGQDYVLNLVADKDWINDSKRVFPIKIDPSILVTGPKLYLMVTDVGRFRWKLTVEYEIRDEEGKVLGSDVVITSVNPGETNIKISAFLRDYFALRLAKWSMAQGKYTLIEMSNDRLSSVHFQKDDNGDDIDDEYKDARLARKQIINSFDKAAYPNISLTLIEAESLQKPEYDEIDRLGKPTGRKVQNKPIFNLESEKTGAGVEILRPNGAGDATGISNQFPASTLHWDKVDEGFADDDTTYVYQTGGATSPGEATDYYALDNTALTSEAINSIDVTSRSYETISTYTTGGSQAGVRLSTSNTFGSLRDNSAYTTAVDSTLARPGGGSWAVGDLNSLQAAVLLRRGYGDCWDNGCDPCDICDSGCFYSDIRLTQIYVTVNYSSPAVGGAREIRGGVNIRGGISL